MATEVVHTVFKREGWVNEFEGGDEIPGKYATKGAAVSAGRREAVQRKSEHVIHNQDGTISLQSSYANAHEPTNLTVSSGLNTDPNERVRPAQ
jgi:hypothetical protein